MFGNAIDQQDCGDSKGEKKISRKDEGQSERKVDEADLEKILQKKER